MKNNLLQDLINKSVGPLIGTKLTNTALFRIIRDVILFMWIHRFNPLLEEWVQDYFTCSPDD